VHVAVEQSPHTVLVAAHEQAQGMDDRVVLG
jgi:hypothetical protein